MEATRPPKHRTSSGAIRRLAALALLLPACIGEDSVVELGVIEHFGTPITIEMPSTAGVGQSFLVTVTSYGGGCLSPERTDVEQTDDGADVIPFDRRRITRGNEVCTQELRSFRHSVALAFDTAGTKTIHVHGRRVSFDLDQEVQVPLTIAIE